MCWVEKIRATVLFERLLVCSSEGLPKSSLKANNKGFLCSVHLNLNININIKQSKYTVYVPYPLYCVLLLCVPIIRFLSMCRGVYVLMHEHLIFLFKNENNRKYCRYMPEDWRSARWFYSFFKVYWINDKVRGRLGNFAFLLDYCLLAEKTKSTNLAAHQIWSYSQQLVSLA